MPESAGGLETTIEARTGVAGVHMVLGHRYVCASQSVPRERCHPRNYDQPEIVYLSRIRGCWQIVKPGSVYRATEIDHPLDAESSYYPPGSPATIAAAVSLPAPTAPCPSSAAISLSPPHKLKSTYLPNPNGGPRGAPWLKIDALAVARLSPETICFTLTLGAPPRPDSAYGIGVGTVQQQAAADLFDVEIDGLGNPHALREGRGALSTPSLKPYLPHVSLAGNQLEIIGTEDMFAKLSRFLVVASSQSSQDDEPLLTRPLDAGDGAPQRGCLTFPTGKVNTRGLCGSTPGPVNLWLDGQGDPGPRVVDVALRVP